MKSTRSFSKIFILFIALFSMFLFLFTGCTTEDKNSVIVEPLSTTENSISPNTTFKITLKEATPPEEMFKNISLEPKQNFSLDTEDNITYTLIPYSPFAPNSDINIIAYGKSFSFKIANTLVSASTYPVNNSENIGINNGLEFIFNDNVTTTAFKEAFTIEPELLMEFDQNYNRIVAYPTSAYDFEQEYTVTVKNTLKSEIGATLTEDLVVKFKTISKFQWEGRHSFNIATDTVLNSVSEDKPYIPVYLDGNVFANDISVAAYQFADIESYKKFLVRRTSAFDEIPQEEFDTAMSSMERSIEFTTKAINPVEGQNFYNANQYLVQFPDKLPQGRYLVELKLHIGENTITKYSLIQVSDLSVYMQKTNDNFLVWVNDTSTKTPSENANVLTEGMVTVNLTTDKEGKSFTDSALVLPNRAEETYSHNEFPYTFFTVTSGDKVFVDYMRFNYLYEDTSPSYDYMSYIFTDRPIYKSTDTVNIWGVIMPRRESVKLPETLYLDISNTDASTQVKVNPDGSFKAELDTENIDVDYSWASVRLKISEESKYNINSTSITIEDYVKPLYTADMEVEKPVYLKTTSALPVNIFANVNTFDGTPAIDFALNFSGWNGVNFAKSQLRTDDQGKITAVANVIADQNTWSPYTYQYSMVNGDPESETFYQTGSINVIHRDIMLIGKTVPESEKNSIEVTTNKIDISKITEENVNDIWNSEKIKGEPIDKAITGELRKVYYTKISKGTYYDYINRKSVETFEYIRHDDKVKSFSFSTVNGKFIIEDIPKSDDDNYYYLNLSTKDSVGRTVETKVSTGYQRYRHFNPTSIFRYNLTKKIDTENIEPAYNGGEYVYDMPSISDFEDNENVTFVLHENDKPIENMKGKMLYTVVQNDISHIGTTNSSEINIPFSEDLVPNYAITGAYFDGKYVYPFQDRYMYFNPKQRELAIDIKTDKAEYKPADKADVTIEVKNKTTNLPVENATIVLAVVDEAIFAITEQNIDILSRLYSSVYRSEIEQYASHEQIFFGGGAEKGGGGGDNGLIRSQFKDTAQFVTATTDSSGIAKINFTLPDNITKWRLTTIAAAKKMAGSAKSNTIATLDYFVMPIVNKEILDGDDFVVGLKSLGNGITSQDNVNYTVTITGDNNFKSEKTTTSTTRNYTSINFGKLKEGKYSVMVKGVCKTYADTVILPFEVIKTGIHIPLTKSLNLADGIGINPIRYPVEIKFYNKELATYNKVFSNVSSAQGRRIDRIIAEEYIYTVLKRENPQLAQWYKSESFPSIRGNILTLFPESAPDFALTVLANLAVPEIVGDYPLELILEGDGKAIPTKSTYYGDDMTTYNIVAKAVLGRKIDEDVKSLLDATETSYIDKMYLITALHLSGEEKTAKTYHDELVVKNIEEIVGFADNKAYYIPKQGETDLEDATAAALIAATTLGTKEAYGLALYITEKPSAFNSYLLEQIYYMQNHKSGDKVSEFTYTLNGKTNTQKLGRDSFYLSLSENELKNANFKVTSGDVYANVHYKGAASEKSDDKNKLIKVTKTYTPVESNTLKVGDLVRVTIKLSAPEVDSTLDSIYLSVVDYVPTGMRFERTSNVDSWFSGSMWYLSRRQEQRLEFSYYDELFTRDIVYYARCTTPGEYIGESTYTTTSLSEIWGESERTKVIINE